MPIETYKTSKNEKKKKKQQNISITIIQLRYEMKRASENWCDAILDCMWNGMR